MKIINTPKKMKKFLSSLDEYSPNTLVVNITPKSKIPQVLHQLIDLYEENNNPVIKHRIASVIPTIITTGEELTKMNMGVMIVMGDKSFILPDYDDVDRCYIVDNYKDIIGGKYEINMDKSELEE